MSYSVCCYAMDLKKLQAACGSRDTKMLDDIKQQFADEISQADSWNADAIASGAPSRLQQIFQRFNGEKLNKDHGFAYGYAVETLSKYLGEELEVETFESMSGGWFYSLPEYIQSLVFRGCPVSIPEISDFPGIGYIT